MAVSSCSLSWAPGLLSNKSNVVSQLSTSSVSMTSPPSTSNAASASLKKVDIPSVQESDIGCCQRRSILMGTAALAVGITPASSLLAEEVPANYRIFVDKEDGYSYYYPADWRDFDFRAHDSAFKDRYLQLQNVRLSFIPTEKADVHELGPMEEYIPDVVKNIYAAPNQVPTIFEMKERTSEGRNYYTVEFLLKSPNFGRSAFATIAIANGRYYTLIVGANERRWKRVRNKLKVVADSLKVFDI